MQSLLEWWDKAWGSRKPLVSHGGSGPFDLECIPDNVEFHRVGSGITVVTGTIGENVHLTILDSSSLRIIGNIASGCKILKKGNGTLTIEGRIADDLELTIYGQGIVNFTQQPPQTVINLIKNRGEAAQIICAGARLELPTQGYRQHNLGVPARQLMSTMDEEHTRRVLRQLSTPPAPAPLKNTLENTRDKYNPVTLKYIELHKEHEKIADRINKLNLNEEEEELFEECRDCIMKDYFTGIPVVYDERYYNLDWLLKWHKEKGSDPFSREPLALASIGSAREIYNKFDDAVVALKKQREAKQSTANQHDQDEEQHMLAKENSSFLTPT
jgi:hypothetical protein